MSRPHEDRERHTSVDHRTGGLPLAFPASTWCAFAVLHVTAERAEAALSAYETLIEKARAERKGTGVAALLRSHDHRRVFVLVQVDGHETFRHLSAIWDDHHLLAEHRAVSESRQFGLYRLLAIAGDGLIDPATSDAYALEHVPLGGARVRDVLAPAAAAAGFRGTLVFDADDGSASFVFHHFTHAADLEAFRATPEAARVLGPRGGSGETFAEVHAVKTFAEPAAS